MHPEDVAAVHDALNAAIGVGKVYRAQYRTSDAEGRCRWVLGLGKLVSATADRPSRFVGLNLDITDSMEAAQELERIQLEVQHLSRFSAMGALASTLAHELSQPLTAISNFMGGIRLSLEKPAGRGDAAVTRAIEGVERSAAYASEVVRRLRDHASGSASDRRRESLSAIVADASYLCTEHGLNQQPLVCDIDPTVDAVLIDRIQIEQVLLNLFRNAREAMAGSASPGRIFVSAERMDRFALIRVCDTGAGLAHPLKAELFSPVVSTKPHGAGIGLSICRTIIAAHGGRIWAEDQIPCGACFCFTLPLADD